MSLGHVAAYLAQDPQLLGGLHPLPDGLQAEGVGQRDHRLHYGRVPRVLSEPLDEGAVDLLDVHREHLEVGEGRVPLAEVVYGQPHPERRELAEHHLGRLGILYENALRYLQEQVGSLQTALSTAGLT